MDPFIRSDMRPNPPADLQVRKAVSASKAPVLHGREDHSVDGFRKSREKAHEKPFCEKHHHEKDFDQKNGFEKSHREKPHEKFHAEKDSSEKLGEKPPEKQTFKAENEGGGGKLPMEKMSVEKPSEKQTFKAENEGGGGKLPMEKMSVEKPSEKQAFKAENEGGGGKRPMEKMSVEKGQEKFWSEKGCCEKDFEIFGFGGFDFGGWGGFVPSERFFCRPF